MKKVLELYYYSQRIKRGLEIYNQDKFETDFVDILFKKEKLSASCIAMLWGALAYCEYKQNPRASNSIYAIPQKIWNKLQNVTCSQAEFDADEISRIFQAIALLQVQWNHDSFHPCLRTILFQSLEANLRSMDHYQIAITFTALGHLFKAIDMRKEIDDMQLESDIYTGLFDAINRNADKITLFDFPKILWGCVQLQKKPAKVWAIMLDHQFKGEFFLVLANKVSQLQMHDLVKIIESLTHLFEHWSDLPLTLSESLQQALIKNLTQLRGEDLATTLWSIARSTFPWETLEESKRGIKTQLLSAVKAELIDFPPTQFAKTCWALAVLGINWQTFDPKSSLLKGIKEKVTNGIHHHLFSVHEINQLQQANVYFNWQLDKCFVKIMRTVPESHVSHESDWQQTVTKMIRKLVTTTPIETESLIGNCKRVDICFPEKKKILELDGNFHQDKYGQPRRKDQFNQAFLEKLGYGVERIIQQEWYKLSKEQHTAYLLSKLQQLGIVAQPIKQSVSQQEDKNNKKSLIANYSNDLFFEAIKDPRVIPVEPETTEPHIELGRSAYI